MSDKNTIITVRVSEKTKESLREHLGEISFKDLILFCESMFNEGDISVEDGSLCLNHPENPPKSKKGDLVDEFYAVCDAMSIDREVGLKKAIIGIKNRKI